VTSALLIGLVFALALPAFAARDNYFDEVDKVNATGDSITMIWQGFEGLTGPVQEILYTNQPAFVQLADITGSTYGTLTLVCENVDGRTRGFNNRVTFPASTSDNVIQWGPNRRNACASADGWYVDTAYLTVKVLNEDANGELGLQLTGKLETRDTYAAAEELKALLPAFTLQVRADEVLP
jgi:hypothetical protein